MNESPPEQDQPALPSPANTAAADIPATADKLTGKMVLRGLLALICSHAVAPYATARFTIRLMLDGTPEFLFAAASLLAITVGGLLALRQFVNQPPDRRRLYFITLIILWYVMAVVQLSIAVDSTIPRPLLAVLWGSGTIWVAWFVWAWSFFRGKAIATGTVIVAAAAIVFWSLIDITGLTGDAAVEVAWRKRAVRMIPKDTTNSQPAELGAIAWGGYLGTDRLAATTTTLATAWDQQPPKELWRTDCGSGWSSFAATEQTFFTQEQIGGEDCVTARRLSSGELIWSSAESGDGFRSGLGGDGPRATPTLIASSDDPSGMSVLAIGPTGVLRRLDAATGSVLWEVDTMAVFPGENLVHGVCGSPLVVGDLVIVCPPSEQGPCLAAFALQDGQLAWQTDSPWRASYASPALLTLAGREQIVVHAGHGVLSVDPQNGTTLWEFEWSNEWDNNATQPVVVDDDELLIATGYRGGAVRLSFDTASQPLKPVAQWETRRTMRTKFCNMAVFDSVIVGLDNGILCGVDLSTGRQLWKKGRYGHGQLLQAGNCLLVIAEKGTLHMLQPDATGHNERGSLPALDRKTWNHPILIGDRLLIRNDQEIVCLQLPQPQ